MTIKMASIPQPAARVKQYWGDRPMGEVRVKVQLRNTYDQMRARRGEIPVEQIRVVEADAVVDTGAVRTVVPPEVVEKLGIDCVGYYTAEYADGRKDVVPLTDAIRVTVLGRDTVEECLVLGDSVLIGQTVLEKTDLLVDCANTRLVPNPDHPDQPVSKVR
jgi:clan AA aspartic protease